jgi:hypothetical protein
VEALTADIIALVREYGRYGHRKITALLRAAEWKVNARRVERIWRREGLKMPWAARGCSTTSSTSAASSGTGNA